MSFYFFIFLNERTQLGDITKWEKHAFFYVLLQRPIFYLHNNT
jgi:hypothetical protein